MTRQEKQVAPALGGAPSSSPRNWWSCSHIGDGWFGGLRPPLAFALTAVAGRTFIVGLLFMPET